ncbi:MAG: hypothetical protein GX851_06055 [Clostridiales bacterium]|jgi:hypothetical protein|nr:hypothetical protein [Clostridiales bacterium]
MNIICPVCGCKTEEFDIADFSFEGGHTEKLCGYCRRQLKLLDDPSGAPEAQAAAAVAWLDSMAQKPVEIRSAECLTQLNRIRKLYPQIPVKRPDTPVAAPAPPVRTPAPAQVASQSPDTPENLTDQIFLLNKRISALEKDLKSFKRRLLISKIISFAAPLVITLILFIILMASGVLDPLIDYFNTISNLADMM